MPWTLKVTGQRHLHLLLKQAWGGPWLWQGPRKRGRLWAREGSSQVSTHPCPPQLVPPREMPRPEAPVSQGRQAVFATADAQGCRVPCVPRPGFPRCPLPSQVLFSLNETEWVKGLPGVRAHLPSQALSLLGVAKS